MALILGNAVNQAVFALTNFPPKQPGSFLGKTEEPALIVPSHGVSMDPKYGTDQTPAVSPLSHPTELSTDLLHGIVPELVSTNVLPSAGQQTSKLFLIRPQSSDGSFATGFAFGKAKPAVINMNRKLGQASSFPIAEASDPEVAASTETAINAAQVKVNRTKAGPATVAEPPRSPVVASDITASGSQTQTQRARSTELSPHVSKTPTITNYAASPPMKITDTATPQDIGSMKYQPVFPEASVHTASQEPTPLEKLTPSLAPHQMQPPVSRSKAFKPKEHPLPFRAQSKVMKSRRKESKRSASNTRAPPAMSTAKSLPTQEDLMDVLLSRYRHDKKARDQERSAHATEIQDLKDISNSLWEQLQEERARGQLQEEEISGYQAKLPRWNAKVKRLSDFIQGLANDHHGLRDKAKEIQEDQAKLLDAKMQLNTDMDDINQRLDDTVIRTKDALSDAKHDMQLLSQKSQNQEAQLRDNALLLNIERERNHLNLTEMGKLSTSHKQLAQSLAAQWNMYMEKLSTLSSKLETQKAEHPESLEELKEMMHQCSSAIEDLRNTATAEIEDLPQLDISLRGYADSQSIIKSVQACQQDCKTFGLNSQESVSEIQQELQALSASIKKERSLTDELTEHCTAKAALEERVHAAEAALSKYHEEVAAMHKMESNLQQKIANLEAEAVKLRNLPQETPATMERLMQIDSQNKTIGGQIADLHEVTVEASRTLQEKYEDYAHMQIRLEDRESQLRQEHEKAVAQAKEHLASEKRASEKHEEDQKHIRLQAKFDRDAMDARHRLEISELKHRLTLSDGRFAKETEILDKLRADKQSADQAVLQQVAMLAQLQNDKEAANATAEERLEMLNQVRADKETAQKLASDRLGQLEKVEADLSQEKSVTLAYKASVSKLDTQFEEQGTKLSRLQQSMERAIVDLDDKAAQIRNLELANAQRVSEAREAIDGRRRAEGRQADEAIRATAALKALEDYKAANPPYSQKELKADSQRSEADSPPKSRRIAHRSAAYQDRPVVQDSQTQPVSEPSSMPQTTPRRLSAVFEEQLEETYKELEDIAGLFPPTPNPSSQGMRPTVKFVADSMRSTNLGSYFTSPLRDHFASDYLASDYITMSQVEGVASEVAPRTPQGTASSVKSAKTGSRNLSQAENVSTHPHSQSSQASGLPKGILKSTRSVKRSADIAGLPTAERETRRRGLHAESQGLGPVIPESQSQAGSQRQPRSRRLSRPAAPRPKVDKYSRRFSQELVRDAS